MTDSIKVEGHWGSSYGVAALHLALLFTFLVNATPFFPGVPPGGFDSCWGTAMDYALDHGFVFGRDLIYTYGPYNDVCTGIFNPARPWRGFLLGLALGGVAWGGFFAVARRESWRWTLAFLFALAASGPSALIPLLIPLLFCLVAAKSAFEDIGPVEAFAGGGLLLGMSLLCLMKLSGVFWCVFAIGVGMAALLLSRKWLAAACVVLIPAASLPLLWLMAGQPLAALPDYFQSVWQISYGYNQAMHSLGDVKETILLMLAGGASLFWLAKRAELARPRRLLLLFVFAAFWFFAIKVSVVRHDAHAIIGGHFALLVPFLLAACFAGRKPTLPIVLSLLTCVVIDFHYGHNIPRDIVSTYATAVHGGDLRLKGDAVLTARREDALRQIAAQAPMKFVPGRVDIYPNDLSFLVAQKMRWAPRPIFESHAAYTPALAEANRAHLLGPSAPDTVFFDVQTIDRRFSTLDDGPSWPVLLSRYAPRGFAGKYAILRRRSPASGGSTGDALSPLATVTAHPNEPIAVPPSDAPVFVRMDMRPTLLGALTNLVYKFNRIKFVVELEDGSRREYRIIPIMARAGFVISPLVESGHAFATLYSPGRTSLAPRVRSMTVLPASGFGWQWKSDFTVRFSAINVPAPDRPSGE